MFEDVPFDEDMDIPDFDGDMPDVQNHDDWAAHGLNDLGNAFRLIRLAGGRFKGNDVDKRSSNLLFLKGRGWIAFNGKFWDLKYGEHLARRMAHQVALIMYDKAMHKAILRRHIMTPADVWTFLRKIGSSASRKAMQVEAESYLSVELHEFDRSPLAINAQNGTVWIDSETREVELRPHNSADRITRIVSVDYIEDAPEPTRFLRSLNYALREEGLREFFHRAMGYAITGDIAEKAFFVLQGKGRDFKSTLLEAFRDLSGSYAEVADVASFLEQKNGTNASGPRADLVKLAGDARLVILSEPSRGAKLDEGLVKKWTGGIPITTRAPYGTENFDFLPKGKLTMECNSLPIITDHTDGMWRRIYPIHFLHQVPESDDDKKYGKKLIPEYPAILNWLIAGICDYLALGGLCESEEITAARDNWRSSASTLSQWLNECCDWGDAAKGHTEMAADLFESYRDWHKQEKADEKLYSQTALGRFLEEKQIMGGRQGGTGRKTRGPIRLKPLTRDPNDKRDEGAVAFGTADDARTRPVKASPKADPRPDPGFNPEDFA